MMFNEKVVCNLEAAAVISRSSPLGKGTVHVGFDVANFLQEMADQVRKADHELSEPELAALGGSYKAMLVFE